MPLYLSRFSYTPETWGRLIRNPEGKAERPLRRTSSRLAANSMGSGTPSGRTTATISGRPPTTCRWPQLRLRLVAVDGCRSFETTVLLTVDDAIAALRKAEQVRYRAPGA